MKLSLGDRVGSLPMSSLIRPATTHQAAATTAAPIAHDRRRLAGEVRARPQSVSATVFAASPDRKAGECTAFFGRARFSASRRTSVSSWVQWEAIVSCGST